MFLLAAVAVSCGPTDRTPAREEAGHHSTAGPTGEPAPNGPTITIEGMGFSKAPTVAPGTQIAIVNNDEVEHSVTSRDDGKFDVHVDGGQRATLVAPSEPGQYSFYCLYHPAMVGTLTVR